jgi:hypothetical protein
VSIFPTKILLATDGSQVHIAYVLPSPTELRGHHLYSQEVMQSALEQAEGEARSLLEEQAKEIGASGGRWARRTSGPESQTRRS